MWQPHSNAQKTPHLATQLPAVTAPVMQIESQVLLLALRLLEIASKVDAGRTDSSWADTVTISSFFWHCAGLANKTAGLLF